MYQAPNRWTVSELLEDANANQVETPEGAYVPSRPLGFFSLRWRLKLALAVFTGKADALFWDEP